MGLFYRRPLALCAFAFIFASVLGFYVDGRYKLPIFATALLVCALIFALSFIIKKHNLKIITVSICFLAVSLAFLHSFVFISKPKEKAASIAGENAVLCYIVDKKYVSDRVGEYDVKVTNVGGKATNIRGKLVCNFASNVDLGDEIYGAAVIEALDEDEISSNGELVTVYMDDVTKCYARYSSTGKGIGEFLISDCGLEILANKLGDKIQSVLFSLLGEEKGALALGFFTGERSDLPAYIVRDFRRSGLSHIMAVSGSHIAILLGSVEALLRRLFVPKGARCAVVSTCGLLFIVITGFSLSGIRSVLMLYAVYLAYLTYEDNDPVTSLFVSIFFIILALPFSVIDLGLWMSFLSTLGLLTVYPAIEEKIPYPRMKNKLIKTLLIFLRQILTSAVITLVANMLLLPVIWYFFGELSLVSVISNIVLGPIASLFLISVPVLLMTFNIPFISFLVTKGVSLIADLILFLVGLFSKIPDATLSLKYQVCSVIIIVFTVITVTMLLLKFKIKLWIIAPYLCTVVLLIGSSVYMGKFALPATLTYDRLSNGEELFIVSEGSDVSVCDISQGSLFATSAIMYDFNNTYATEIDKFILTHYHSGHIDSFDFITQNIILRDVYLPIPLDDEEKYVSETLWNMAKDRGINVYFYECGEELRLSRNSAMKTIRSDKHEKGRTIAFYGHNGSITYSSPAFCDIKIEYDRLIIGGHGVNEKTVYDIDGIKAKAIYVTSKEINKMLRHTRKDGIYQPEKFVGSYCATFVIDQ